MADETIMYEGRKYLRRNGVWYDSNMAKTTLQSTLNKIYRESIIETKPVSEKIIDADGFKASGSFGPAAKVYEAVLNECSIKERISIFSKLSSCYRSMGRPMDSVELYLKAKREFGDNSISTAFLTSVAAAYCDLGDIEKGKGNIQKSKEYYDNAKLRADNAYAKSKRQCSGELSGVYGRIRKARTGSGRYEE